VTQWEWLTWCRRTLAFVGTYVMHNLVSIIVYSMQAPHTSLSLRVFTPHVASILCLEACLMHNIAISFVSEYHNHPSVKHASTHQGI